MGQVDRAFLEEVGLELVYDYGLLRNEQETNIFKEKMNQIETDGFWGFGNNYALTLKHMKEHLPDVRTVVDIGCCWGVFSYMFKDYQYIGVEEDREICEKDLFIRYYPHHQYVAGGFPYANPGGDVFIASMSLGYGGTLYHQKDNPEVINLFLDEISRYKYGYIKADKWVEDLIAERFEKVETIGKVKPVKIRNVIHNLGDYMGFWKRKDM
ncbi:hypothetical protein PP175_29165 (plasmid) [Aneurinibacillus sp. Ricciae_BoGa-3]|uniref:hypothetical protein n=1 Tax=Aneurinibacillus sp. Ricciae_BoGa-3 TaxID=3022697 RepID=UPI00234001DF|nr:hypothetical protein [Aneurinibacillus sp. Ricciae_BoGa-3]WCK57263.1 hypothetical protein PP175_29165 [Aneurinibacillus sp. Ricciae_BoGa-3]